MEGCSAENSIKAAFEREMLQVCGDEPNSTAKFRPQVILRRGQHIDGQIDTNHLPMRQLLQQFRRQSSRAAPRVHQHFVAA